MNDPRRSTAFSLLDYCRDGSVDDPERLSLADWELLIRQARYAKLLSRIATALAQAKTVDALPEQPRTHLQNAIKVSAANCRSAGWEIRNVYDLLHANQIDFILLKGCAYLWTGNQASIGRLFGDTDILVRKSDLHAAEVLFTHNGWVTTKLDNYDQHYYRKWMHELPPLHHTTRHTSLDVHHHIVPPISAAGFDIDALWDRAVEDADYPGLYTLHPLDMILHSATHLLQEGEFEHGFRDLVDLDTLMLEFVDDSPAREALVARAADLGLAGHLYHALDCRRRILQRGEDKSLLEDLRRAAGFGRSRAKAMGWILDHGILPDHVSMRPRWSGLARGLLLVRSHWIKMPWYLLLWHLYRKSMSNLQTRNRSTGRNYAAG